MRFSYNWLKDYIKGRVPKPEKLAELLTLHSFEIAEIKKVGRDYVLNIDVLPNRGPDCFSHIGIVREIAILTNSKLKTPGSHPLVGAKLIENKALKAKDFVKIEIKNKNDCSRYTARVITDIKVKSSPKWMQLRLKACGLRPINNIVDIANFVMLETGQPLHAFDGDKIAQNKIIVRRAKKGEKITTLDGKRYNLDGDVLLIADAQLPIGIAGIKGGKIPEVKKSTKTIILESANFNPKIIRQGSKKLNLKTDASWRFEHGIDPNLTEIAANRGAALMVEFAGGKIIQGIIDFYPQKRKQKRIKLDLDYTEKLLGVKISKKEIISILKKLDFRVSELQARKIIVEVPTWRLDINIAEDLIEEIGRIAGLQKIPRSFPFAALIPPQKNIDRFWESFSKNILKEVGLSEVYNYSFIGKKDREISGCRIFELIEVKNPISSDFQYLRPSLIPNLLKNIRENQKNFEDIRIFELGKIFRNYKEKRMLAGIITGDSFYELKGTIDLFFTKLGISNVWYDNFQPTPEESKITLWNLSNCAEIKTNGEEVGFLGEIKLDILEKMKIKGKLVVFDLDFEKLQKLAWEETIYQPLSQYPAAIRDISLLVPKEVRVAEVLNVINTAGGEVIRDIDLFDVYEGEEIPEEKKNLAFHIIYQAKDRTLSSEEIDTIQEKIIQVLEKNPDWEIRK